jgi:hypothetical protein
MRASRRPTLPLAPLLRAYAESGPPPESGPRGPAVRAARAGWLHDEFLDSAGADEFRAAVLRFYEAVVTPPLHAATLARRAGLVRHGLAHLLRSPDPLPVRLGRCLDPAGPYFVAGRGPAFWSAAAQALDPDRHPAWTPPVLAGLRRLGLVAGRRGADPAELYAAVLGAYERMLADEPRLTALHLDHFLTLVARMRGRDLWAGADAVDPLPALIRQERSRVPLRRRLKERGKALADAREQLLAGLKGNDAARVAAALAAADPASDHRRPLDWELHGPALLARIDRLYHADDPLAELPAFDRQAQLCGAGRWLAAAVLHLRSPRDFPPWDEAVRAGVARIDDALGDDYPTFAEAVGAICDRYRLHPLEAPAVLAEIAEVLSPTRQRGIPGSLAGASGSRGGSIGARSWPRHSSLSFQLLDHLRQQRGVVLLEHVVDARLRHAELLHRRRRRLPDARPLGGGRQVQLRDQLRQPLPLHRVLVRVVPLDDLLLVGCVVVEHEGLRAWPGGGRPCEWDDSSH